MNDLRQTAFRAALLLIGAILFTAPVMACNLNAWSGVQDPGSALSVTESARFDGSCGLHIDLDIGAATAYVEDTTPGSLSPPITAYVGRFYIYIGDMQLAEGDVIKLFSALDAASGPVFAVQLYAASGRLYSRLVATGDDGGTIDTSDGGLQFLPGWRAIEASWTASSGDGMDDGELTISLDGIPGAEIDNLTGLDTDTLVIDSVQLGLLGGNTGTVTGFYDVDSFASGRTGTTGLVDKNCSGVAVTVENMTFLPGAADCTATGGLTLGHRVTFDPGSVTNLSGTTVTLQPGVRILQGAVLAVH